MCSLVVATVWAIGLGSLVAATVAAWSDGLRACLLRKARICPVSDGCCGKQRLWGC